jgi:hypothetical protein
MWQQAVVQALCASPVLADRNARAMLAELIGHALGRPVAVREQPTVRLQFLELVRFCLRAEGGQLALLQAVEAVEGPGLTLDAVREQVHAVEPEHAAADPQHAAADPQHTATDLQHAAADPQHTATDLQHVSADPSHASADPQHASADPSHPSLPRRAGER